MCTNTAVGNTVLRQIHRGSRQADSVNEWSERTLKLEARTAASQMSDMLNLALSPEKIESYCGAVKRAHEEKIDTGAALKRLVTTKDLTKSEAEKIGTIASMRGVHEMLPDVHDTAWHLSNAISWFAKDEGSKVSPSHRIELEQLAGKVIHIA